MRFIGFHGPAGVGKGTAAQIACEKLAARGYVPVRRSFGDVIRAVAGAMANRDPEEYLDVEVKKDRSAFWTHGQAANLTNREFLQRVGSMIRGFFEHGVLIAMVLRLPVEGESSVVVVIDDVRMPEEAEFIHDRKGSVIRIVGPDRTGTMTSMALADRTAASLPENRTDFTIQNTGSIEDLRKSLGDLIAREFGEEASA